MTDNQKAKLRENANAEIRNKSDLSETAEKILDLLDENERLVADLSATQNVRDRAIESLNKANEQNDKLLAMLTKIHDAQQMWTMD